MLCWGAMTQRPPPTLTSMEPTRQRSPDRDVNAFAEAFNSASLRVTDAHDWET